jgi:hypothetical protein
MESAVIGGVQLRAAFEAGELGFFGELAALAEPSAFSRVNGHRSFRRSGRLKFPVLPVAVWDR